MTDKIKKDQSYYDRGLDEVLASLTLDDSLKNPPSCFSVDAAARWRQEISLGVSELVGRPGYYAHGFDGPYHMTLGLTSDQGLKFLTIYLTSDSDLGERIYMIPARPLIERAEYDVALMIDSNSCQAHVATYAQLSVRQQIERMRQGQHASNAFMLKELFEQAGLNNRWFDFDKDFFSFLRLVLPIDPSVQRRLGKVYVP